MDACRPDRLDRLSHESLLGLRSREINPRHIASNRPVRAVDRLAEVDAEIARLATIEAELRARPEMAGVASGSAEYHRRLALLLAARGEEVAARGHGLRALEAGHDRAEIPRL